MYKGLPYNHYGSLTWLKYSSEILVAHSWHSSVGRQGLEMSAHLTKILFMAILFSGLLSFDVRLVDEPVSPSTCVSVCVCVGGGGGGGGC